MVPGRVRGAIRRGEEITGHYAVCHHCDEGLPKLHYFVEVCGNDQLARVKFATIECAN
jgi:hypothetical protein